MNAVMHGVGMMIDPRYLVYKSINGKLNAEIQHGEHTTGEGIRKDEAELKRIKLLDHNLTLSQAVKMYPYEEKK